MKGFFKEFGKFIQRGNVLDMAVGVVIGNAFGKIVTSLVNDIIMPVIGIIIGGQDFTGLKLTVNDAEIMYGSFIQNVIDFLIIAFCIFCVIRAINKINERFEKFKKKEEKEKDKEKEKEEKKDDQVILLEEIRDLLKNNKK